MAETSIAERAVALKASAEAKKKAKEKEREQAEQTEGMGEAMEENDLRNKAGQLEGEVGKAEAQFAESSAALESLAGVKDEIDPDEYQSLVSELDAQRTALAETKAELASITQQIAERNKPKAENSLGAVTAEEPSLGVAESPVNGEKAEPESLIAKIKKELPNLDKLIDEELHAQLLAKVETDEGFRTKAVEYAKSIGVVDPEEAISDEELVRVARHFKDELSPKRVEVLAARYFYDKAKPRSYGDTSRWELKKLGPAGEEGLVAISETYLDAYLNLLQHGHEDDQEKAAEFQLYLQGVLTDSDQVSNADDKKRLLTKLEQVISGAKKKVNERVVPGGKRSYDDLLEQVKQRQAITWRI